MFLRILPVLGLAAISLASLWAQGPAPDLPPGPMQAKVKTACMECHDSGIIVQQRLDRKSWTKEVDKMVNWGALVEKQDRDAFVDYLSTNFPPDKPAALPGYKASTKAQKSAGATH